MVWKEINFTFFLLRKRMNVHFLRSIFNVINQKLRDVNQKFNHKSIRVYFF